MANDLGYNRFREFTNLVYNLHNKNLKKLTHGRECVADQYEKKIVQSSFERRDEIISYNNYLRRYKDCKRRNNNVPSTASRRISYTQNPSNSTTMKPTLFKITKIDQPITNSSMEIELEDITPICKPSLKQPTSLSTVKPTPLKITNIN